MQKLQSVLLVSRPVCPPWDEGSKNAVRLLALNMQTHVVHLMAARERVRRFFSWPSVVERTLQVYNSVLARRESA